jgi:hypothetical protein
MATVDDVNEVKAGNFEEFKVGPVDEYVKVGPVDEDVKVGPVDEELRLIRLRSGALMPSLGMGTWHHGPKEEIQDALRCLLPNKCSKTKRSKLTSNIMFVNVCWTNFSVFRNSVVIIRFPID